MKQVKCVLVIFICLFSIQINAQKTSVLKGAAKRAQEWVLKHVLKSVTIEALEEGEKKAAKLLVKDVIENGGKELVEIGIKDGAKDAAGEVLDKGVTEIAKKTAQRITNKNAMSFLVNKLDNGALKYWNKILDGNTSKELFSAELARDLVKKQSLVEAINKNPNLLSVYLRNIDAPVFRSDVNILRYFDNRSNLFKDWVKLFPNRKWKEGMTNVCNSCVGNNLHIAVKNGKDCIIDKGGSVVGTIRHYKDGYIIHIGKDVSHSLLNMPLLPNTQYKIAEKGMQRNITTNKNGLMEIVDVVVDGKTYGGPNKIERAKRQDVISGFRDVYREMDLSGRMNSKNHNIDDDGGHIIPRSWGGLDEGANLFAQNHDFNTNTSGKWQKAELAGKELLEGTIPGKIHLQVRFFYPDNSMRPNQVIRKQYHNGKKIMEEVFKNVIEKKAS